MPYGNRPVFEAEGYIPVLHFSHSMDDWGKKWHLEFLQQSRLAPSLMEGVLGVSATIGDKASFKPLWRGYTATRPSINFLLGMYLAIISTIRKAVSQPCMW